MDGNSALYGPEGTDLNGPVVRQACIAIVDEIERFVFAHENPDEAKAKLAKAGLEEVYNPVWFWLNPEAETHSLSASRNESARGEPYCSYCKGPWDEAHKKDWRHPVG